MMNNVVAEAIFDLGSIQDKENVYLCMEYMPGGDLYYWLEKYDTFDENIARFYLAETVMALEALHKLGFIHRDLKPDNMLLDAQGHLKLADFGSCVRCDPSGYHNCTSPIGTPDYISPEMLNCQSKAGKIGPGCDWWALGVIAYEMFFGEPAFYGQSLVQTYSRILNHENALVIPPDADPLALDTIQLIKDFLKSAELRLGSLDAVSEADLVQYQQNRPFAAAQYVKAHPFFKPVQWDQLHSVDPPIRPTVNSETDTSNINFDERDLSSDGGVVGSGRIGGGSGPGKLPHSGGGAFAPIKPPVPAYFTGNNLSFAGYTFNRYHQYLEHFTSTPCVSVVAESSEVSKNALAELNEQHKLTKLDLKNFKASYQQLECQLVQDQISLKETTRRLVESVSELDQMKMAKHGLDKLYAELQNQCNQLQSNSRDLEYGMGELRTHLADEQHELSHLKVEKLGLIKQIAELQKRLTQSEHELYRYKDCPTHPSVPVAVHHSQLVAGDESLGQQDLIKNLQYQIQQLASENQEARVKASLLITEASNLRRNYDEQIQELNAQIQSIQRVNHNCTNRVKEFEDQLEQTKLTEQTYLDDLVMMRDNLQASINSRRAVEDQLVGKESALAVANVKLRNLEVNLNLTKKLLETETNRWNGLNERRLADLTNVSEQLDEMRAKCAQAEASNDKLTDKIMQLELEKGILQRNMQAIVEKLYSEVENHKSHGKKTVVDRNEYKQFEKKYKKLELSTQKEIGNLHVTLNHCKRDLADQNQINKTLTEECQAKYRELAVLKQLERSLRSRLDYLVPSYSTPIKSEQLYETDSFDGVAAVTADGVLSFDNPDSELFDPLKCGGSLNHRNSKHLIGGLSGLSPPPPPSSFVSPLSSFSSSPNLTVDDLNVTTITKKSGTMTNPNRHPMSITDRTRMKQELLNTVLEDIMDMEGKGKGKNKLKWVPKYAVLKPFVLTIYESRVEREAGSAPIQEIPLCQVIHAREVSELDLIHAKKEDIKRTIQLFVRKSTRNENIGNGDATHRKRDIPVDQLDSSNVSSSSSSMQVANQNSRSSLIIDSQQSPPHWNGHQFHSMRFRLGNILCDICHKVCSDLISPPEALECIHCRLRIHSEHVEKHEKIASCDDICYVRMPSNIVKKLWIDHLNVLRACLQDFQTNPNQLHEFGLSALANASGGVNNIGINSSTLLGAHFKSFHRSMRAGSMGPTFLNQNLTIPPNQHRCDSLTSLHVHNSSFRQIKSTKRSSPTKLSSPRTLSPNITTSDDN